MLPALLDQIPPDQQIAGVTADGALDTRHVPRRHRRTRGYGHHPTPEKRQAMDARHGGGDRTKRSPARIQTLRPDHLATMMSGQPAIGSKAAPNATTAEAASKPR